MTRAQFRRPDAARIFGRLFAAALRILAATWRVQGVESVLSELDQRKRTPLLIGFWHGKYIPLLALFRGANAQIFTGEGSRGRLIGAIAGSFGMSTVFLPHGDRKRAIECMRKALEGPVPCATAFDGPVGPPRQVKTTLVELASEVGATVLPISMFAKPQVALRWRWDLREIPLPFARVRVRLGDPIEIPVDLPLGAHADWRDQVKAALDELDGILEQPYRAGS